MSRVADPPHFNADPDPIFDLNADPENGLNDAGTQKVKKLCFIECSHL
jgi:hypothetical protein